jgi:hypothetical protein
MTIDHLFYKPNTASTSHGTAVIHIKTHEIILAAQALIGRASVDIDRRTLPIGGRYLPAAKVAVSGDGEVWVTRCGRCPRLCWHGMGARGRPGGTKERIHGERRRTLLCPYVEPGLAAAALLPAMAARTWTGRDMMTLKQIEAIRLRFSASKRVTGSLVNRRA